MVLNEYQNSIKNSIKKTVSKKQYKNGIKTFDSKEYQKGNGIKSLSKIGIQIHWIIEIHLIDSIVHRTSLIE